VSAVPFRARVLQALLPALRTEPHVLACWEGGSVATGRADAFSDIDLCLVAEADQTTAAFATVEVALAAAAPIAHTWRVEPAAFPHLAQRFYLLAGAPPFFAVDCSVLTPAGVAQFMERERHGEPVVHFDRCGLIAPRALDRDAHAEKMRHRFEQIRAAWPVYRMLVQKELARGRPLDAIGFYLNGMLRLLVELAGLRFRPARFDFGWRYLHHDVPAELQQQLRSFACLDDHQRIGVLLPEVDALAARLIGEIEAQGTTPSTE
jgi:predicted nucleotidyltransferase